jgi:hypothetical protein
MTKGGDFTCRIQQERVSLSSSSSSLFTKIDFELSACGKVVKRDSD